MTDLTVADQLFLERLSPELRGLIDRVVASRLEDRDDSAYQAGYRLGVTAGRRMQMAEVHPPIKDIVS